MRESVLGAFVYVSAIFPNYPNATIPHTNQDPHYSYRFYFPVIA